MSISFTSLAWHAPIDVWVGWYLVRRVLAQNKHLTTLALSCGIGLFYGLWGICWWNEPPQAMKVLLDTGRKDVLFIHFVRFAFGTTALLVLAHWLYQRVRLTEFNLIFYYIATPLGALFWLISVVACGRRIRIQQAFQEPA